MATGTAAIDCDISGVGMIKTGNGTLLLGGTNSYASTTIVEGVLQVQTGAALPNQTALTLDGGVLDLSGTASLATVTLNSGSIVGGTLQADAGLELYVGTVLANLTGPGTLNKLGLGTVVLVGDNTYTGGSNVMAGTLIAGYRSSLTESGRWPGDYHHPAHAILVRQRRLDHGPMATGRWHADTLDRRKQCGSGCRLRDQSLRTGERECDHRRGQCRRSAAARFRCPPGGQ